MRDMESGRSTRVGLSDAAPAPLSRNDARVAGGSRSTQAFYEVPLDPVFVRSDRERGGTAAAAVHVAEAFMNRVLARYAAQTENFVTVVQPHNG